MPYLNRELMVAVHFRRRPNNSTANSRELSLLDAHFFRRGKSVSPGALAISLSAVPPFRIVAALGMGLITALNHHVVAADSLPLLSNRAGTSIQFPLLLTFLRSFTREIFGIGDLLAESLSTSPTSRLM